MDSLSPNREISGSEGFINQTQKNRVRVPTFNVIF